MAVAAYNPFSISHFSPHNRTHFTPIFDIFQGYIGKKYSNFWENIDI